MFGFIFDSIDDWYKTLALVLILGIFCFTGFSCYSAEMNYKLELKKIEQQGKRN